MSIVSAPAFHGSPGPEIDAMPQTKKPPKSVIRDQEFLDCRSRICECIQALERNLASQAPSVKSGHSMNSKASGNVPHAHPQSIFLSP